MVFVCATVIEGGSGKVLVPWEIYQCHVESTTILEFCRVTLFCKIASSHPVVSHAS